MAGAGAKKRLEENRRKLQQFKLLLLAGGVSYGVIRMWAFKGYQSGWHWTGFILTVLLELIAFSMLSARAAPTFGPTGELEDGGLDLNKPGGISSYCQDLLWLSAFVQVLGSIWAKAWYTYLAVPGYAIYMLFKKVPIPYFSSPSASEQVVDEAMRKKLEKTEARAQRRRMKWR